MRSDGSSHAGFSLIEVLLSLSIFAIISIAVYSAFAGGIGVWRRAQEFSSTRQMTYLILEEMAGDIQRAVRISGSPFVGESQRLSFLTLRHNPPTADSSTAFPIRRITYELRSNQGSSQYGLYRLDESYAEGLQDNHREPDLVAGGIAGFALQYASKDEDQKTPWEWKDIWEGGEAVPPGVRITLMILNEKGEKMSFTKTVFIPQGLLKKKKDEHSK